MARVPPPPPSRRAPASPVATTRVALVIQGIVERYGPDGERTEVQQLQGLDLAAMSAAAIQAEFARLAEQLGQLWPTVPEPTPPLAADQEPEA